MLGPTASGKSAVAMAVAELEGDVELVSVDSMQVYRGMDIGTAKPTEAERVRVRHHLIDLVEPTQEFSVTDFQHAYRSAVADIDARGRRAVLVGGTGLYHRAVIDEFDMPGEWPELRAATGGRGRGAGVRTPPCSPGADRSDGGGTDGTDQHPPDRPSAGGV